MPLNGRHKTNVIHFSVEHWIFLGTHLEQTKVYGGIIRLFFVRGNLDIGVMGHLTTVCCETIHAYLLIWWFYLQGEAGKTSGTHVTG